MKSFVARMFFDPQYREARLAAAGEAGAPQRTPKMEAIRQAHIDYLGKLKAEGKLFCGGPLTDYAWALEIYKVDSLEEARSLADQDPYTKNGIFTHYEIKEWQHRL